MKNLTFKYIESETLLKYDSTFKKFSYESNNYPKVDRYILTNFTINEQISIPIDFKETEYGYRCYFVDGSIILVNAGENIYYLANYSCTKKSLIVALYNFIYKYNSVIDVTKFHKTFKNIITLSLGKKAIEKEAK